MRRSVFATERLNDGHAGNLLVHVRVHLRRLGADGAIGLTRPSPDERYHHRDERRRREADQREPPIHPHHHDDDAHELDEIDGGVEGPRREQLEDGVDVVRDAGNEPSDGLPVEERELSAVQKCEDLGAQIRHGSRAGYLNRVHLNEVQRLLEQNDGRERRTAPKQYLGILRDGAAIDRDAHDVRPEQREPCHHHAESDGEPQQGLVGPDERPEPRARRASTALPNAPSS